MFKKIATASLLLLSGCVSTVKPVDQAYLAAIGESVKQNEDLAQAKKITWAEASRREVATAEKFSGAVDPGLRAAFDYKIALAAEIDAGRMTREMAAYKYSEKVAEMAAQEKAAKEASEQATREAIGNILLAASDGMQAYGQSYQQAYARRPIQCSTFRTGIFLNTNCN